MKKEDDFLSEIPTYLLKQRRVSHRNKVKKVVNVILNHLEDWKIVGNMIFNEFITDFKFFKDKDIKHHMIQAIITIEKRKEKITAANIYYRYKAVIKEKQGLLKEKPDENNINELLYKDKISRYSDWVGTRVEKDIEKIFPLLRTLEDEEIQELLRKENTKVKKVKKSPF